MIEFLNPQTYPHNSNQYPLKRDKNQHIQGIKVQHMLNQVNQILDHLLKDLQYLYKANGINYIIGHYHNTLIRILTPFQLLSHFQIADNQDLFDLEGTSKVNDNTKINQSVVNKQILCFTPGYIKQEQIHKNEDLEEKKEKKLKYANKKYFYRKDRAKPILDFQTESILTEWALKKLSENKRVRRKDLAIKAIKLSGNMQGFYGSIGWVNRFLNRHPKLKQQIMKVAKSNIGMRRAFIEDSQLEQNDLQFQRMCHNRDYQNIQKGQEFNENQFEPLESQYQSISQNYIDESKSNHKKIGHKSQKVVIKSNFTEDCGRILSKQEQSSQSQQSSAQKILKQKIKLQQQKCYKQVSNQITRRRHGVRQNYGLD